MWGDSNWNILVFGFFMAHMIDKVIFDVIHACYHVTLAWFILHVDSGAISILAMFPSYIIELNNHSLFQQHDPEKSTFSGTFLGRPNAEIQLLFKSLANTDPANRGKWCKPQTLLQLHTSQPMFSTTYWSIRGSLNVQSRKCSLCDAQIRIKWGRIARSFTSSGTENTILFIALSRVCPNISS